MQKTWGEIKNETLNLGFEKSNVYDKNKESFIGAYNWAQNYIAVVTGSVIGTLEIEKEITDYPVMYDLVALAEDAGQAFISIASNGITDKATGEKLGDIQQRDNRFLVVPASYAGTMVVWFVRSPEKITTSAAESTVCEIPYKWATLMPYYMANRLFMDDDASKAGYYWNLAEDMRREISAQENRLSVTVTGGINIDGVVW